MNDDVPTSPQCPQCHKSFRREVLLRNHIRVQHPTETDEPSTNKQHKCDYCKYRANTRSDLKKHIIRRHEGMPLPQKPARIKAEPKDDLEIRKKVNRSKSRLLKGECDLCNQRFPNKKIMSQHRYHDHKSVIDPTDPNSVPGYPCYDCKQKFSTKRRLSQHRITHRFPDTAVYCEICDEWYKDQISYGNHINEGHRKKNSGKSETKYRCDLCGLESYYKLNLAKHIQRHYDAQMVKCDVCEKTMQRHSMYAHLQLHWGHKPYECPTCGKRYTYKGDLKDHLSVHDDKRPYQCDLCEKFFKTLNTLRQHKKRHTTIPAVFFAEDYSLE